MNLKHRFSTARGVTLIELVVVIAVAGILAAVSAPTITRALQREQERTMVNAVANQLREARNQAMARGEAIRVYVGYSSTGAPTRLETYRTSMQLPDGTWELGTKGCVAETEDVSTDACPPGSVCMDGGCWGRPARSCRELTAAHNSGGTHTIDNVRYERVADFGFERYNSAELGIRLAWGVGTERAICFAPDGSAQATSGGFVMPYGSGTWSCPNEGFNVWIAHQDSPLPYASIMDHMRCDSPPADYEKVHGYVLRVMNNGEISLRSPAL